MALDLTLTSHSSPVNSGTVHHTRNNENVTPRSLDPMQVDIYRPKDPSVAVSIFPATDKHHLRTVQHTVSLLIT